MTLPLANQIHHIFQFAKDMSLYCLVEADRVRRGLPGPPLWPYQPYDDDFFRDVPVACHEVQLEVLMADFKNYWIDCFEFLNQSDQEHLIQPLLQHLESIEKTIHDSFRSYGHNCTLALGADAWDTVKRICVEQDLAREKANYKKRVQTSPSERRLEKKIKVADKVHL